MGVAKKTSKKLRLSKESLGKIAGSAWHRTTLRCHQTYDSQCPTNCETCNTCFPCDTDCGYTCQFTDLDCTDCECASEWSRCTC